MRTYRDRLKIPISDDEIAKYPFYRPEVDSEEYRYLKERREALGGWMPRRWCGPSPRRAGARVRRRVPRGHRRARGVHHDGLRHRAAQAAARSDWGKLVVPIIPDEARTFGMEALFRQIGIYSSVGQLYEPVDKANLLYYRESETGRSSRRASPRRGR
jgi:pyruvate dehydrogenase E1 component